MSTAAGRRRLRRGALLLPVLLLLVVGMLLVTVCTGGSRSLTLKPVAVSWNERVHAVDEAGWWSSPSVQPGPTGDEVVTLPADLLFASGSYVVRPAGASRLRNFLEDVASPRKARLAITCHSDSTGDAVPGLNQRLSEDRALNVEKLVLDAPGFQNGIVTATGRGSSQPVASNATETGRTLNRRCEITIRTSA